MFFLVIHVKFEVFFAEFPRLNPYGSWILEKENSFLIRFDRPFVCLTTYIDPVSNWPKRYCIGPSREKYE